MIKLKSLSLNMSTLILLQIEVNLCRFLDFSNFYFILFLIVFSYLSNVVVVSFSSYSSYQNSLYHQ